MKLIFFNVFSAPILDSPGSKSLYGTPTIMQLSFF